ncbi:hypothetical protein J7L67_08720 [bacterium]|nr:hypothetical protein [bacterium]
MKKILFFIAFLFFFIPSLHSAYSATLIDTGEPPYSEIPMRGSGLERSQTPEGIKFNWVAGKITLNDYYNINSIKSFFDHNRPIHYPIPNQGPLIDITLVIYGNTEKDFGNEVAEVPDLNTIFYTDTFGLPSDWQYGWYGLENINWLLLSGEYWIALEIHNPVFMETFLSTPPNTLEKLAQTNEQALNDVGYFPAAESFALRIEGDVVPEPISICLFTFGAFLLKIFTKRN